MVPARIVQLAALPSTPQGKIDRAALAAADAYQTTAKVAARNELEGRTPADLAIRARRGRDWRPRQLLRQWRPQPEGRQADGAHPQGSGSTARPAGVLPAADDRGARGPPACPPDRSRSIAIPRLPDAPSYAVSHAQRRLWLLEHLTDAAAYNIAGAYVLDGLLDVDALDRALSALVVRHESLRTTFVAGRRRTAAAGGAGAVAADASSESTCHAASDPDAAWREILAAAVARRFDLEHGPLLRCTLVVLGPTRPC